MKTNEIKQRIHHAFIEYHKLYPDKELSSSARIEILKFEKQIQADDNPDYSGAFNAFQRQMRSIDSGFSALLNNHPKLSNTDDIDRQYNEQEESLLQKKMQLWQKGSSFLKRACADDPIIQAAKIVLKEIEDSRTNKKPINYNFYIATLNSLEALRRDSTDSQALSNLSSLATFASGSPTIGKKIAAGLLAVLAVSLLAAAVVGVVFGTGPIASPMVQIAILALSTASALSSPAVGYAALTVASPTALKGKLADIEEDAPPRSPRGQVF